MPRHPVNHTAFTVLRHGSPARRLDRGETGGPVAPHARQYHSHASGTEGGGHGREEGVGGRARPPDRLALIEKDFHLRTDLTNPHVEIRRCDPGVVRCHRLTAGRLGNAEWGETIEPRRQRGREPGRHVLNDQHRGPEVGG